MPPSNRRGFGRARRLPSGNWQAFYNDPHGAVRMSSRGNPTPVRHNADRTFVTKLDAEAWLAAEFRLISAGDWTPPADRRRAKRANHQTKSTPFRAYAERWVIERRSSTGEPLRPLTRDKYRSALEVHIYPTFGDRPLGSITREDVKAWYATVAKGRPTARAHAYNTFRSILRTAVVDDEILDKNPVNLRGAGARRAKKRVTPATFDELALMVEAMPARLRLLLQLATWCALRSGELRELRRSDVTIGKDGDGNPVGWVHIRRGVVTARADEPDGNGRRTANVVGAPKSEAGVRVVAIPEFLLPEVREHLLAYAAPGRDGLLFPSARDPRANLPGATLNGRAAVLNKDGTIARAGFGWREARRRAGRKDLDLHDLRHTGASMAGEEGASLAELMHRLGHSTPSMAMAYQHSRLERDRELARRLSTRAERGMS